jgi:hypothetical protein
MKKYEELLIDYAKYLSTMKDEVEEYTKTGSPESYYLIINDFPAMKRMKEKLIKILPKSKSEETLSKLRKYELEIYRLLKGTPLAEPFAETVGLNLHHQQPATAAGSATKS